MIARLIAILAILHGTVFLGAGNALEHLVHQMQAQESEHQGHHNHHQHHAESSTSSGGMTDEEWMNCVFCLDGLMGTGISVAWLTVEFPAVALNLTAEPLDYSSEPSTGFYARAPPQPS